MDYKCDPCNYVSHDLSNFIRHKKSKKHQNNEKRTIKINSERPIEDPPETQYKNSNNEIDLNACQFCCQTFKHKTHLYRHQKYRCVIRIDNENKDKEIEELKNQNKKLIETNLNNQDA